jgi:hypothetical protein
MIILGFFVKILTGCNTSWHRRWAAGLEENKKDGGK